MHTRFYRELQAGNDNKYIKNPVSCVTAGSAVVFDGITDKSYPVYNEQSLLNSNMNYDFGDFKLLETMIKNGSFSGSKNITSFVVAFKESGVYVFKDS